MFSFFSSSLSKLNRSTSSCGSSSSAVMSNKSTSWVLLLVFSSFSSGTGFFLGLPLPLFGFCSCSSVGIGFFLGLPLPLFGSSGASIFSSISIFSGCGSSGISISFKVSSFTSIVFSIFICGFSSASIGFIIGLELLSKLPSNIIPWLILGFLTSGIVIFCTLPSIHACWNHNLFYCFRF